MRFFGEGVGEQVRDRRVMARALGSLYCAGALIALLSLVLPHWRAADLSAIAVLCAVALGFGLVLMLEDGQLPRWTLPASCFAATLLIAGAIYFSGSGNSAFAFYFVLVAMYAAYFLSTFQLVLQTALIAVVYPLAVALMGGAAQFEQRWLLTIWTIVVVGAFIAVLRRRMIGLMQRLAAAASTDPLTRLLNRRGFRDVFELELERSRRGGRPCALVVGDLDHFKRVNDMLGHPAGDDRLQKVAQLLEAGKRRIDAAARLGGEEFALLLPDTDEHGAYVIAERLRHDVRDAFAPDQLALTVSFGVAAYPTHGTGDERLLHAADQALYVAKALGRDRTAIYRAEVTAQMLDAQGRRPMRADGNVSPMLVLAEAVDLRGGGSMAHSEAVGRYAEMIAGEMGLDDERVARIKLAGLLHDIGKVGVSDAVLQKAGPLDGVERDEVQMHCELGSRLLTGAGLDDLAAWVLAHHERPDGLGYPARLEAAAIPLEARILAVADAYEAMVADRAYRSGIGADQARAELGRGSGTQFDEVVVDALLRALDRSERPMQPA